MTVGAAAVASLVLLSACSTAGSAAESIDKDLSAIVVEGSAAAASPAAGGQGADLDIDDQAGDGRRVDVESVSVGSSTAFVVITDEGGTVLGWDTASTGVQPVSVVLETPIAVSAELIGLLVRDDGDGVLDLSTDLPIVDDDGEAVEEDFDYRVTERS